jgi:hypothetical protein
MCYFFQRHIVFLDRSQFFHRPRRTVCGKTKAPAIGRGQVSGALSNRTDDDRDVRFAPIAEVAVIRSVELITAHVLINPAKQTARHRRNDMRLCRVFGA